MKRGLEDQHEAEFDVAGRGLLFSSNASDTVATADLVNGLGCKVGCDWRQDRLSIPLNASLNVVS